MLAPGAVEKDTLIINPLFLWVKEIPQETQGDSQSINPTPARPSPGAGERERGYFRREPRAENTLFLLKPPPDGGGLGVAIFVNQLCESLCQETSGSQISMGVWDIWPHSRPNIPNSHRKQHLISCIRSVVIDDLAVQQADGIAAAGGGAVLRYGAPGKVARAAASAAGGKSEGGFRELRA
jgi:hypothetical protein